MLPCINILEEPEPAAHIVQLYGNDRECLTRHVSRYLGEGLRRGDGLLVVATMEHTCAFAGALSGSGAYQAAVRESRLVFLDAAITLARFMVDGQPDRERFDAVIGGALAQAKARARTGAVRAYGEMVGLLWQAGQCDAAVGLEGYWNTLLASQGFSLFCGYPIAMPSAEAHNDALDAVLRAHTHVLPAGDDPEHAIT